MKAQRVVWGETLADLAGTDERVLIIDGDLATSTRADILAETHPDRFVQAGIAEQNMVGMAFGLTTVGYRPWLSSFGVFLTNRALDQVRMLLSQTKAPVRLAGAYAGLLNGASGKTHQDPADLAIMCTMPNMTVLAPADAVEAEAVIRWAAEHDGPVYLRLARDAVEDVFGADYVFRPELPVRLQTGDGSTVVVSTGVQTSRTGAALRAVAAATGSTLTHVHLPMLKPLSHDALAEELGDASTIVTVEEHSVINGLGALVSEVVTERGQGATVHRIGLADGWSESGPNDFLLDKYGLSAERVAERIQAVLPTRVQA